MNRKLELYQQDSSEDTSESGTELHTLWVVTLGDMMTTLTIFFLVLYAWNYFIYLQLKDKKIDDRLTKIQNELKDYVKVQFDRNEVRVQLSEAIMFDLGSAELKPSAKSVLHDIAKVLKSTNEHIIVEGHTDNYPIISSSRFRSNWHLSCARAFSVVKYLIDYEDIQPKRISGWGYAEYRPIAPFDTIENRAKNRRIEIVIMHEKIDKESG